MFWSEVAIPGKPRLLMVDGFRNEQGWEGEFLRAYFQRAETKRHRASRREATPC